MARTRSVIIHRRRSTMVVLEGALCHLKRGVDRAETIQVAQQDELDMLDIMDGDDLKNTRRSCFTTELTTIAKMAARPTHVYRKPITARLFYRHAHLASSTGPGPIGVVQRRQLIE
ncbi:hypothetical protein FRB94_006964 [Tulasnella sp. JGI-2019a]|nr:hypothetical protein FRB94_006964 [Tulasnella sp. JGI-2019a]KAG9012042.1 hypothetical protein FRB93_002185 [Tulasnella sp. JGI-2019a]KAG9038894.1 hypothetical protein FRB95_013572 [Tulasnella sp. JGI-2019a]